MICLKTVQTKKPEIFVLCQCDHFNLPLSGKWGGGEFKIGNTWTISIHRKVGYLGDTYVIFKQFKCITAY